MQNTWENGQFVLASTKDERINRLSASVEALERENKKIRNHRAEICRTERSLRAEVDAQGIQLAGAATEAQCKEQEIAQLRAEVEALRAALRSIAGNTCCDPCQEARRVAVSALAASSGGEEA